MDFAAASGRYLQVVRYCGVSQTALGAGFSRSNWVDPALQGGGGPAGGTVPEARRWALAAQAVLG